MKRYFWSHVVDVFIVSIFSVFSKLTLQIRDHRIPQFMEPNSYVRQLPEYTSTTWIAPVGMWPLLASTQVKSQLRGATRILGSCHYKNVKIIFAEKWILHRSIPWQSLLHHRRCSNSHAPDSPCFWIFVSVCCVVFFVCFVFCVF